MSNTAPLGSDEQMLFDSDSARWYLIVMEVAHGTFARARRHDSRRTVTPQTIHNPDIRFNRRRREMLTVLMTALASASAPTHCHERLARAYLAWWASTCDCAMRHFYIERACPQGQIHRLDFDTQLRRPPARGDL